MTYLRRSFVRLRRTTERTVDQAAAVAWRRLMGPPGSAPFDGQARLALLTVNYSTTRYLKLMLLTLSEQQQLQLIKDLVICDNNSRDGGAAFLRKLASAIPPITLVENSWWADHARGMRLAQSELKMHEQARAHDQRANVLLHVDPDIVFRRPDTLGAIAAIFENEETAFAGELRRHNFPYPEAQASFLAVRRDWATRRDIAPWVNHGQPAYWLQRDIWKQGGKGTDFPANQAGYILHRGRAGVQAAQQHSPWSAHAAATHCEAHYMGISEGERIWNEIEGGWGEWLEPHMERQLIERMVGSFEGE